MTRLTIPERILLAAGQLDSEQGAFSAEDLVVRVWKLFPSHFGLQKYANDYPDSNRVLTKIMGSGSALRTKGWLTKVGAKRYQLTDVGRHAARQIQRTGDEAPTRLAAHDRGLLAALRRMLSSSALSKYSQEQPLTFGDVCGFWNISPRTTAHQFARRSKECDAAIDLALQQTSNNNSTAALPGNIEVTESQLRLLQEVSAYLREKFAEELSVIEDRKDERRL